MPTAEPIVLLADLTAYQAAEPQPLIDAATAMVRSYCGWHLTPPRTETVTVRSTGSACYLLPSLYVTAIAAVSYGPDLLVPVLDYSWSTFGVVDLLPNGPYFSNLVAASGPVDIAVTFTHGLDAVPDVAAVILAAVSRATASPDGVFRSQVGLVAQSYSQSGPNQAGGLALLPNELAILHRYRLHAAP